MDAERFFPDDFQQERDSNYRSIVIPVFLPIWCFSS
jgi:hypothetical protein